MTLLQVASLAFGYGADRLFQGVTFSLALGERMALVAPNGAGKSTLLKALAGDVTPASGRVILDGCDLFNAPALAGAIAFRGGTAIHKLLFDRPLRYSEDIDLVQISAEPPSL